MRKLSKAFAFAALLLSTSVYAQTAPAATTAAKPIAQPWLYEGSDVPVDDTWTLAFCPMGFVMR